MSRTNRFLAVLFTVLVAASCSSRENNSSSRQQAALSQRRTASPLEQAAETSGPEPTLENAMPETADTVNVSKRTSPSAAGRVHTPASISAKQLMRQVAEACKSANTIEVESEIVMTIQSRGVEQTAKSRSMIILDRPNRLAIRGDGDFGSVHVVSDGDTLLTYVAEMNAYMEEDAPESLDQVLGSPPVMMATGGGGANFAIVLLSDDTYDQLMQGTTAFEYLGESQLDGKAAHHLKFTQVGIDWEAWLSTDSTPLLKRISIDMSKAVQQAAHRSGETADADPSELRVTMVQDFRNWRFGGEINEDVFDFTPPDGAQLTDNLFDDAGDGIEDLSPLLGQAAPLVELELLDGGVLNLANHLGKEIVLLDFWATWCGPCVAAMPGVAEIAKEFKSKGVVLYSVNQGEEPESIREFLEAKHLDVTVALDKDGAMGDRYALDGIPTIVVVDKQGIVQVVHVGYSPQLKQELRQHLNDILAGKNLAAQAIEEHGKKVAEHEAKRKERER